jgi:hypothetical protein
VEVKKSNKENMPNAGLLTIALRSLGYDNLSAVSDIMDNSLDAEASLIKLEVLEGDKFPEILIADDGFGMDWDTLDQALRLGSDVSRDLDTTLGKFGMGLSTGSLALARRVEVITRHRGTDIYLKSFSDAEEVISENDFVKYLGEASDEDIELFHKFLPTAEHGTIIRLMNCDKIKNTNLKQFKNTLKNEISRVFREFISSGKKFYVNGEECLSYDPMMLPDGGEVYSDESYDITFKNEIGEDITELVRLRLVILPDFGQEGNRERKINSSNSGFYVLRNNREVISAKSFGFFTKHPSYNRFRGEIYFSDELDELMGVNFTKKNLDIHQSIFDKINTDLKHQLRAIRKQIEKGKATISAEDIDHKESERLITKKASLLNLPKDGEKKKVEFEASDKGKREKDEKDKDKKKRIKRPEIRCRFEAQHDGKGGHFYEARMEGKTVVIVWNIDHPFYERFVVSNKENKTLATSIDFLVYSLATAELQMMNDENIDLVDNFKTVASMNLSTLLR